MQRQVSVRRSGARGNGLYADQSFSQGQIICRELPRVGVQHAASRAEGLCCARCFQFVGSPLELLEQWGKGSRRAEAFLANRPALPKQDGCNFRSDYKRCRKGCCLVYCSSLCEERSWGSWHQLLCPMVVQDEVRAARLQLSQLADTRDDKLAVAAQVLATVALTAERESPERAWADWVSKEQPHWHHVIVPLGWKAEDPHETVQRCRSEAKVLCGSSLELLCSAMPQMAAKHKWLFCESTWSQVLGMLQVNGVALQVESPLVAYLKQSKGGASKDQAQEVLQHVRGADRAQMDGFGMCDLICNINHDCEPNAVLQTMEHNGTVSVVALQNVAEGAEILIAYIDTEWPVVKRQLTLQSRYGFVCSCRRCNSESRRSESDNQELAQADSRSNCIKRQRIR